MINFDDSSYLSEDLHDIKAAVRWLSVRHRQSPARHEGSHRQHGQHGKGLSCARPLAMAARDRSIAFTPTTLGATDNTDNTV